MGKLAVILVCALSAWLAGIGSARADTTVRVVETWPAGDVVTLAPNQNFYLRLAYDTDVPVQIWARPYFRGKEANAGSNPSQTYTGSGETFGWFFLMEAGDQVDEIRISAGDGGTRTTPVVATVRVHVTGGATAAAKGSEPAWIGEMTQRAEAAQRKAYETRKDTPTSAGDMVFFSGFMLVMLTLGVFGFVAPAWGVWRWRGGWRLAAAVPAAAMVFVVLRIAFGTLFDPTSHNLWPFEILQMGGLSVVAMGALLVARKLSAAKR